MKFQALGFFIFTQLRKVVNPSSALLLFFPPPPKSQLSIAAKVSTVATAQVPTVERRQSPNYRRRPSPICRLSEVFCEGLNQSTAIRKETSSGAGCGLRQIVVV